MRGSAALEYKTFFEEEGGRGDGGGSNFNGQKVERGGEQYMRQRRRRLVDELREETVPAKMGMSRRIRWDDERKVF